MDEARTKPWNPDRRWADPLITLLLLVSFLGIWGVLAARKGARPEPQRPGMRARAVELRVAAQEFLQATPSSQTWQDVPGDRPWDRALLSILAAEQGQLEQSRRLAGEAGIFGEPSEAFQRCWKAAYGEGPAPLSADIEALREPLGGGFAYWHLRAKLAERESKAPAPFLAQGRSWALPRLLWLGLGGISALLLAMGGLVMVTLLLFTRKGPRPLQPLPSFAMSWRALLLALLGWFVALRFSGTVAALLLSLLPLPEVMALPIAYGFHATVGTLLLLRAEGSTLRAAWRRLTPGPLPRALGWGLGFLGIAIASVFFAGLLFGPLVRGAEPPQRELLEMVSRLRNPAATLLLLATIAGLAPLFEEGVFRGVLLPWLGPRLAARHGQRAGWGLAILLSGLGFGAMHLQPAGLPGLATLGLVLGWAFFRTGNLWTTIAMHACWNASVFLFVRILA